MVFDCILCTLVPLLTTLFELNCSFQTWHLRRSTDVFSRFSLMCRSNSEFVMFFVDSLWCWRCVRFRYNPWGSSDKTCVCVGLSWFVFSGKDDGMGNDLSRFFIPQYFIHHQWSHVSLPHIIYQIFFHILNHIFFISLFFSFSIRFPPIRSIILLYNSLYKFLIILLDVLMHILLDMHDTLYHASYYMPYVASWRYVYSTPRYPAAYQASYHGLLHVIYCLLYWFILYHTLLI